MILIRDFNSTGILISHRVIDSSVSKPQFIEFAPNAKDNTDDLASWMGLLPMRSLIFSIASVRDAGSPDHCLEI